MHFMCPQPTWQDSSGVEQRTHKPKVGGSNPPPATVGSRRERLVISLVPPELHPRSFRRGEIHPFSKRKRIRKKKRRTERGELIISTITRFAQGVVSELLSRFHPNSGLIQNCLKIPLRRGHDRLYSRPSPGPGAIRERFFGCFGVASFPPKGSRERSAIGA